MRQATAHRVELIGGSSKSDCKEEAGKHSENETFQVFHDGPIVRNGHPEIPVCRLPEFRYFKSLQSPSSLERRTTKALIHPGHRRLSPFKTPASRLFLLLLTLAPNLAPMSR